MALPRASAAFIGALALFAASENARAIGFNIESLGVEATLNTTITAGTQWRTQKPSDAFVGKANLDPGVCSGVYQSCQGLFRDQLYPSQQLFRSPGAPSMRVDDGNLSYSKWDLTQGSVRFTQDLTATRGDFGIFVRTIGFYDVINEHTPTLFPNLITADNMDRVGTRGDPIANRYFEQVFGPGERTEVFRSNPELRRQLVRDFQLLDANFYGKLPIPGTEEKTISFKLGRQTVNWGESTLLVINSINQAQPVNANNLARVGFLLEEVFTPVAMAFVSSEIFPGSTLEAFYQFEWKPVEAPAPGSFLSTNDIGTNNLVNFVNLSFGGSADDASREAFFLDNPLSLVTATTAAIRREPDREAKASGQFGFALKNFFENLNGGSEISLYFMNYHSRLPYVSFREGQASCARREGNTAGPNGTGIDARNTLQLLQTCPRLPALVDPRANAQFQQDSLGYITTHLTPTVDAQGRVVDSVIPDLGVDPTNPAAGLTQIQVLTGRPDGNLNDLDDLVKLDSGPFFLEYPENIQLYGISGNTTLGDYSIQGEVAYRPNLPLQVAVIDVAFAGAQNFLTRCHEENCAGSSGGSGFDEAGNRIIYNRSDADLNCDATGTCDTVNLILGAAPSSARSFPSFLHSYRGRTLGEGTPGAYVRGYERMDVLQYNLGITRVLGATDNPFGADQIIALAEFGATHVPGLPSLDELQIDAPGVYFHASAGADGSGADGSQQACSTNQQCVVGGDAGRFNPHQANLEDYADKFAWGYRLVNIVRYESVLPGISIAPFLIWSQDVKGTAPGPGENFIEGRKIVNFNLEVRYKSDLSATLGYTWFFGGGDNNLLADRDNLQAFVRYLF